MNLRVERRNDRSQKATPGPRWRARNRAGNNLNGSSYTIKFASINWAALAALPAVLARVLPSGKIDGREYVALNPTRADHRPGSFKVRLSGSRAGSWADFASGHKGGDPVSLIAYIEGVSQVEAARLLARMLCLDVEGARRE
jgi:hypothetical protein